MTVASPAVTPKQVTDDCVSHSGAGESYFVLVPAAGKGLRLGASLPKQYCLLNGKPVLHWALANFLAAPEINKICVMLAADDEYWPQLACASSPKIMTAIGGSERCQSVWLGLQALAPIAQPHDWVIVHDAARPCLQRQDLQQLMTTLQSHAVGGLLATPTYNTIKQQDPASGYLTTLNRNNLWQALTPQMFRYGVLVRALALAFAQNKLVTDEAAAVELLNVAIALVPGRSDNIKITAPADLALAAFYLKENADV